MRGIRFSLAALGAVAACVFLAGRPSPAADDYRQIVRHASTSSTAGWTAVEEEMPPLPPLPPETGESVIEIDESPEGVCFTECDCSPGTLLQWSYGNSFGGGPDLDEPLVTDRPDFTEASSTVGMGVAQLELGYTYIYNADDGGSTRNQSLGEPLLRYGVFANWLELRVALFPVNERTTAGGRSNTTTGTEDLYLGMKIGLTPQEGLLPEIALVPQMTVPTGSNAFSNDETLPGVNCLYGWDVNDFISTAGSTQVNRSIDPATGRSYAEFAQSWTVAYSLADRLGAYTEWFAIIPHSADTAATEHYVDGGFTYLISDDIQFDVRVGKGLNHAADDYFVGSGLSIRFK